MDNMDVKEEGDGEPDGMDDEDMLEDDPKDDNPEESEIREMRNRLEPLYLIWINGCFKKTFLAFLSLVLKIHMSQQPRKTLACKNRCLVIKELTWVFDTVP